MSQRAGPPGVQSAPAIPCYNCGETGHYFDTCLEPTRAVPFGLAASQAAKKAASLSDPATQVTKKGNGPVITRYPPPGPVITRYPPPPNRSLGYNATLAQQQQFGAPYAPQPQPFGQPQFQTGYAAQQYLTQFGPQAASAQTYGYQPGPQYPPAPQFAQQTPLYDQNGHFVGYGAPTVNQAAQMPMQNGQQYPLFPQAAAHYGYQPQMRPPYGVAQYPPAQNFQAYPHVQQYGAYHQQAQFQPQHVAAPNFYPQAYGQPQQYQVQPHARSQSLAGIGNGPIDYSKYPNHGLRSQSAQQQVAKRRGSQQSQSRGPSPMSQAKTLYRRNPSVDQTVFSRPDNELASTSQVTTPSGTETPVDDEGDHDFSYDSMKNIFIPATECDIYDDLIAFDPDWEESTFEKFTYPKPVAVVSPVSLDFCKLPLLWTSGAKEIKSKYTSDGNEVIFERPIEKTQFWDAIKDDPAIAPIDYDCLEVKFGDWDTYFRERQAWYKTTEEVRGVQRPERPVSSNSNGKNGRVDDLDDDYRIGTYGRGSYRKKSKKSKKRERRQPASKRQSDAGSVDRTMHSGSCHSSVAAESRTHTPQQSRRATPINWDDYDHGKVWRQSSRERIGAARSPIDLRTEQRQTGYRQDHTGNTGHSGPYRQDSGYDSHRTSITAPQKIDSYRPGRALGEIRYGPNHSRQPSPYNSYADVPYYVSEERRRNSPPLNNYHRADHYRRSRSPLRARRESIPRYTKEAIGSGSRIDRNMGGSRSRSRGRNSGGRSPSPMDIVKPESSGSAQERSRVTRQRSSSPMDIVKTESSGSDQGRNRGTARRSRSPIATIEEGSDAYDRERRSRSRGRRTASPTQRIKQEIDASERVPSRSRGRRSELYKEKQEYNDYDRDRGLSPRRSQDQVAARSRSRSQNDGQGRKRARSPSPVESPLSPTSRALLGEVPFDEPVDNKSKPDDEDQEKRAKRRRQQKNYGAAFDRRW